MTNDEILDLLWEELRSGERKDHYGTDHQAEC